MKREITSGSAVSALAHLGTAVLRDLCKTTEKLPPDIKISIPDKSGKDGIYTCGFGKSPLMPEDEVTNYCIAGYNIGKKLTGINDLCYARAFWVDDNTGYGGVLFITLDVIGVSRCDVELIRQRLEPLSVKSGCRGINVMSTHNHETIDTLGPWGELTKLRSGRVDKYMECVFDSCVKAAEQAYESKTDGKLFYGTYDVKPTITEDGRFVLYQDDSRFPIETVSTLARFRFVPLDSSLCEIHVINYSAHAEALFGDNTLMSADFPGAMERCIKDMCGAESMYINGSIGGLIMPGFFYSADSDAINITVEQLKAVPEALRSCFDSDANNENGGYPVAKKPVLESSSVDYEQIIRISDERDLRFFARQVSEGMPTQGVTVKLDADIDLNGVQWNSIGSLEKRFRGVFDGCGFGIYGMVINSGDNTGFFAALGKSAVIKDLHIADGIINGRKNTGGIAGYADCGAKIVGCENSATITGTNAVGGIVGRIENGSVFGCANFGAVSGSRGTGGVVGYSENTEIKGCFNRGTIKCSDIVAAGICAEGYSTDISCCYNTAAVFTIMCRNAGQIAGMVKNNSSVRACFGNSKASVCPAVSLTRVAKDGTVSVYDQMEIYGDFIARCACSVKDKPLEAKLSFVRVNDSFKIKNTVLSIAALGGLINNHASVVSGYGKKRTLTVRTGITLFEIGGVKALALPGELFTELLTGAHLDDIHAGNPAGENPTPLSQILGNDVRIFGLCNDEIGYIVPPNDYVLHESLPYINPGKDRNGKIHYEETNSLGPDTAHKIVELATIAAKALINAN